MWKKFNVNILLTMQYWKTFGHLNSVDVDPNFQDWKITCFRKYDMPAFVVDVVGRGVTAILARHKIYTVGLYSRGRGQKLLNLLACE